MSHSALEVVRRYIHLVWNTQALDLIPVLCADPIVRHDAKTCTMLTHEQQINRIAEFANRGFAFSDVILTGDAEYITSVWNLSGDSETFQKSGIEVFKVAGGKITDVWNSTYVDGHWA